MLKLEGVSKSFQSPGRSIHVLRNLSLSVSPGEFVSFIGVSGSGKTTLLKTVASLIPCDRGSVKFTGTAPPRPGFMFQTPPLLPWKSALGNVMISLPRPNAADRSRALDCLRTVGLEKFATFLPHQLSGGMKARTALAQNLFLNTDLLLLDEPFASLDEINRELLHEELVEITEKNRITVLFVTHSVTDAVFLSDRILVLTPDGSRDSIAAEFRSPLGRPRSAQNRQSPEFYRTVEDLRGYLRNSLV